MSDPFDIFKRDPSRQETLKILWPDLYECLGRLDEPEAPRVIQCAVHREARLGSKEWNTRPAAVARVSDQFGPPACRGCIDKIYGPDHQGWPLKRERAKTR
jgi:hypothetical protein